MSSHYTTVNNNYIIVNNIFSDCIIIIYAGSVFLGHPVDGGIIYARWRNNLCIAWTS